MTITAAIPESRIARAGCSAGLDRSWNKISGDALINTQSVPLDDTAIDDCVRAFALIEPLRTPAQLAQLQFHWGKPPPAAEPRTRIFMIFRRFK
jgi:hypothetical protein